MIKLVIFDMDGVLVDAKEIHYESLNRALDQIDSKYVITREEHLQTYDGLPTKKKLEILSQKKNLPKDLHSTISSLKQQFTVQCVKDTLSYDERLVSVLKKLKEDGLLVYVASNAVRESVKLMLLKTGLLEYVDYFMANEDAKLNKPHPEIYLKCMIQAGIKPSECMIVEDSAHGRQAAIDSGAFLCGVDNPYNVSYEKINAHIIEANTNSGRKFWQDNDTNILIPMCGSSKDFYDAGFTLPKFLIEVKGRPMIQNTIESLAIKGKYIFVVKNEDYIKYNLKYLFNVIAPGCEIVISNHPTEGIVSTTLLAKQLINNDKHLIIAHEDQIIDWDSSDFCYSMISEKYDAGITTFKSEDPKFSYTKIDENGFALEVYEKKVISENANCGVYFFNKGSDYVKYGEELISRNIRINNLFFDSMVFNLLIEDKKRVKVYQTNGMKCLGYPTDISKL